jgi:small subunit ribosomal protein S1
VLDIDRDRQRISLGLKQTQEDPWQKIVAQHNVGDIVDGRVTKIVAFGAFVEICAGIEGLVHISELANRHVERPDEVVSVGQNVQVKIIEVDSQRRRLSLSIKRVDGDGVKPLRPATPVEESAEPEAVEEPAQEAAEVTTVTDAVEESAEESAVEGAAEEPGEETVAEGEAEGPPAEAPEEEPVLGLSDDVFPVGGTTTTDDPPADGEAGVPGDEKAPED